MLADPRFLEYEINGRLRSFISTCTTLRSSRTYGLFCAGLRGENDKIPDRVSIWRVEGHIIWNKKRITCPALRTSCNGGVKKEEKPWNEWGCWIGRENGKRGQWRKEQCPTCEVPLESILWMSHRVILSWFIERRRRLLVTSRIPSISCYFYCTR